MDEEEEEEQEEEDQPPGAPQAETAFSAVLLAEIRAAALASVASLGERDEENRQLGGAWPDYWHELVRSQGPEGEGADVERAVREFASARGRDVSQGLPPDLLVTVRAREREQARAVSSPRLLAGVPCSPGGQHTALAAGAGVGARGSQPGGASTRARRRTGRRGGRARRGAPAPAGSAGSGLGGHQHRCVCDGALATSLQLNPPSQIASSTRSTRRLAARGARRSSRSLCDRGALDTRR